jgi:hypothetical protein
MCYHHSTLISTEKLYNMDMNGIMDAVLFSLALAGDLWLGRVLSQAYSGQAPFSFKKN